MTFAWRAPLSGFTLPQDGVSDDTGKSPHLHGLVLSLSKVARWGLSFLRLQVTTFASGELPGPMLHAAQRACEAMTLRQQPLPVVALPLTPRLQRVGASFLLRCE
jgi:hypothetical protein